MCSRHFVSIVRRCANPYCEKPREPKSEGLCRQCYGRVAHAILVAEVRKINVRANV